MPRGKEPQADDKEEPRKKILRRVSMPKSCERRQTLFRKCKKIAQIPKSTLNICDLPPEMLEKIIRNINIFHHDGIRNICRTMRDVSDRFIMYEFRKALKKHTSQNVRIPSLLFEIIKHATEAYTRSGFGATYVGCMLPLLRWIPSFSHQYVTEIKKTLSCFYRMVTARIGDGVSSQRCTLLYTITLMKLIKALDKTIIASTIKPLQWEIVIELRQRCMDGPLTSKSAHGYSLLTILSEILMLKVVHERTIAAMKAINSHWNPTIICFTVHGSRKICNLFRSCLEDKPQQFQWPSKWPNDPFNIILDMYREARHQHMELRLLDQID